MLAVRLCPLLAFASRRITFSSHNHLPCLSNVYKNFYCNKPLNPVKGEPDKLLQDDKAKTHDSSEQSESPENQWQEYEKELKELNLVKRLTKLFKDYWYVGLPTAGCVSLFLFGTLYFIATLVDIRTITDFLRRIHVPEGISEKLEKSEKVGSIAIALILYKLASPIRYALTIYLVIFVTKFLVRRGHVKPFPSKHRLKEMIQDKVAKSKEKTKP